MLNCLIIDDEPLARAHIAHYISRIPDLKLVGSARNPAIGKRILEAEAVDIIFLDVRMPQVSGIDFVKNNTIFQQVVLITAYPQYAIDGFEIEATDYLMKPVTFERFSRAVDKVKARIGGSDYVRTRLDQPEFIYVKHQLRYEKLVLVDIYFIESMLNYIRIVTSAGQYTVYSSLKQMEESLPSSQFIRIHKSYIVAIGHISSIASTDLVVGTYRLPVSRARKAHLKSLVFPSPVVNR